MEIEGTSCNAARWLRESFLRDLLLPGFVGFCLNAISFYEVGFNAVPILGPLAATPLVILSESYFRSGIWSLVAASAILGAIARTPWVAWLAFYAPALLARMVTGSIFVVKGDANALPVSFAGELILAVASLLLFWTANELVTRNSTDRMNSAR